MSEFFLEFTLEFKELSFIFTSFDIFIILIFFIVIILIRIYYYFLVLLELLLWLILFVILKKISIIIFQMRSIFLIFFDYLFSPLVQSIPFRYHHQNHLLSSSLDICQVLSVLYYSINWVT